MMALSSTFLACGQTSAHQLSPRWPSSATSSDATRRAASRSRRLPLRLRAQLGDDALVLVNGPAEKPQFLQPVLAGLGTLQPLSITEVDHLFPAAAHPLKPRTEATLEEAVYAPVLVGDGVTIASEIGLVATSLARRRCARRPRTWGS